MSNTSHDPFPIAIIGAGPVGLAAAANLLERGLEPLILEAGPRIAASMSDWGHVRLFTPWEYLIDPASQRFLETSDKWIGPRGNEVPLAAELVEKVLEPLAQLKAFSSHIKLNHRVVAVTRLGHDRMKDGQRSQAPFQLITETSLGQHRFNARAVIDASGTFATPNPMGAGGVWADGESKHKKHIRYGMPDVLAKERTRYTGKHTLVVGSGHSAIGTVLDLAELALSEDRTTVSWAVRGADPTRLWGGGEADEIAARGALGTRVYQAVQSGSVNLLTGVSINALRQSKAADSNAIEVIDMDGRLQVFVDEIVVATGSRPDLSILRELRLDLDIATESTKALGPLIDPNHHSCGSVPPHGALELKHPETGFFIVGMKSYGRAPTFLLRTGYEQVRSVVAELAGDIEAARRVELTLPQTGVCSTNLAFGAANQPPPAGRCC